MKQKKDSSYSLTLMNIVLIKSMKATMFHLLSMMNISLIIMFIHLINMLWEDVPNFRAYVMNRKCVKIRPMVRSVFKMMENQWQLVKNS